MKSVILNFSGGGTEIPAHVGALTALHNRNVKPDVITGVSAGAILSVPAAILSVTNDKEYLEKITNFVLNIKKRTFMKVVPLSLLSFFRIFLMILPKFIRKHIPFSYYNSIGVQNIKKPLKKFVTERQFAEYKQNKIYPDVYILAHNYPDNEKVLFPIKNVTYERFLDIVAASSAIPLVTQPIEIDGKWYYDGGFNDHSASLVTLELLKNENIKEVISVYIDRESTEYPEKPNNIGVIGNYTINVTELEKSINDRDKEKDICQKRGIKLTQILLPKTMTGFYETKKEKLETAYRKGLYETQQQYNR